MKKKLLMGALLTVVFVCLFAIGVSAASYKINYDNKASAMTNENGTITLRETVVNNLNTTQYTIKDADGNDIIITQQFLGWYTEDGRTFKPGETITVTEDTRLYQASGATVYNEADLRALLGLGWWCIKLGADIETSSKVSTCLVSGTTSILDLNGHNVTTSAKTAFGAGRSGLMIVGKGTITHTGTEHFFTTSRHGAYGDGNQKIYVGSEVTVLTEGTLFYGENNMSGTDAIPKVKVWGTVKAKNLAQVDKTTNALVEIYEGADVTLTDTVLVRNRAADTEFQMYINIKGGKITLPADFAWFDTLSKYSFSITGGSINIVAPELVMSNGYGQILNEETGYYDVVLTACTVEGSNGVHNYQEAELYGEDVNCFLGRQHYYRCACGDYYVGSSELEGHDFSVITVDKPATVTEIGIKRVTCARCGEFYTYEYAVSAKEIELEITIQTANGEKQITILADDLYDMTIVESADGYTCTINAFKNFVVDGVTYTKADIVILAVPSGTTNITASVISDLSLVKEINFMDRANVSLGKNSVVNCPLLEKITFGECDVVFTQSGSEKAEAGIFTKCPLLTTLDFEKANVTFSTCTFASNATIKHVIFGTGKTYKFQEGTFWHSKLEEVVFPDNSNVTLGKKSFAETETIKYIYIGANAIANKRIGDDNSVTSVFGGNSYLAKVVLMDVEYIGKWSLSTKKPGNLYQPLCDLVIYAHSENFSFHSEAFNDRAGNYTVYIYTADPDMSSATSSSNYVIYKGLGHKYFEGVITPSTCVTNGKAGYYTDCTCGIEYRENAYTVTANKQTSLSGTYDAYGTEERELPLSEEHAVSTTVIDIIFKNGYGKMGTLVYKCQHCDSVAGEEETPSFPALFISLGYSAPETGEGGVSIGFSVNHKAIFDYEGVTGTTVRHGLFIATDAKLGENDVLGEDEKPADGVVKAEMPRDRFSILGIKITGFENDEQKAAKIVLGVYVIVENDETKKIAYVQEGTPMSGDKYSYISYNDIVQK